MLKKLADEGSEPLGGSPRRFAEFLQTEHAKWGSLVRAAGIRLD
jgi:tripartite-type tricarboxylate transporter receptor subunit TctC